MNITLDALIEAAQNAGADGEAPTPEQAKKAMTKMLDEAGSSRDEITALQDEALETYQGLAEKESGEVSDDDLLALEVLAGVIETTREVQQGFDAADEAKAQRLANLNSRILGGDNDDEDEDEDEGNDVTQGSGAGDVAGAEGAEAGAPVSDQVPVTASAKRFRLSDVKNRAPKQTQPPAPTGPRMSMVASADVRGFSQGQELDGIDALVAAAAAKAKGMPRGMKGVTSRGAYATLRFPYSKDVTVTDGNAESAIRAAVDETRLEGGNLVAAGGWCAPSETLYDLSPLLASAGAGVVSLPDISVTRGGIRTTEGADFSQIYAGNVGIVRTEEQDEEGLEKVMYRVPCTNFAEVRADTIYTGIEAGILQNDAYPELTKQHVEGSLIAHAHKVNASTIARMVAQANAVDLTGLGPSTTGAVLNGLEMQIVDIRYQYRAPETMTVEVVAPLFLKALVRADLALRHQLEAVQVTDAMIEANFAMRGANVQWVYDWQDAYSGSASGFGGATAITTFPDEVEVLMYPAGTFVRGRGEVVSLEMIYDSVNIKENDYLALFVEEKLLVHRRQYHARNITFATHVSGANSLGAVLGHGGAITVQGGGDGGGTGGGD